MSTAQVSSPTEKKPEKNFGAIDRCAENVGYAWLFQIDSAIVLALENLAEIEKVNIEGLYEDIEVYERSGAVQFYQAKLKTSPGLPSTSGMSQYSGAMRQKVRETLEGFKTTLAKIEREKLKAGRLVFLTNALYPLGLFEDEKWEKFRIRKYKKLSGAAQEKLRDIAARNGFPLEKLDDLWVCVISYERNDEGESVDCPVLEDFSKRFLGNLLERDWQWPEYISHLRSKGAVKSVSHKFHLTKKDIIWLAIVMNMEFSVSDYREHFGNIYDRRREEKLRRRYTDIISFTENRLDLMTNVISKFRAYESEESNWEKALYDFAKINTDLVKSVLSGTPEELTEEQFESLCAHIIVNILMREDVIHKAKKKYNLK